MEGRLSINGEREREGPALAGRDGNEPSLVQFEMMDEAAPIVSHTEGAANIAGIEEKKREEE